MDPWRRRPASDPLPIVEALDTRRYDAGADRRRPWWPSGTCHGPRLRRRGSGTTTRSARRANATATSNGIRRGGRARGGRGGTRGWRARRTSATRSAARRAPVRLHLHVPGVFVQDDVAGGLVACGVGERPRRTCTASTGVLQSARVGACAGRRLDQPASSGAGFFAPTPLTEETRRRVSTRYCSAAAEAERGRSASVRPHAARWAGHYHRDRLCLARRRPHARRSPTAGTRSSIGEGRDQRRAWSCSAPWRQGPTSATASYTYVRSREGAAADAQDAAADPAPQRGRWLACGSPRAWAAWEWRSTTPAGSAWSDPYRDDPNLYVIVGVLAERRVGRVRLFINAENLTNVPADDGGIRSSALAGRRTAVGPSTRGRRSTGACSTAECGSISDCHAIRVQSPICPM